jgi:hypothetical protein
MARLEARRPEVGRVVLSALIVLLQERAQRSSAALTGMLATSVHLSPDLHTVPVQQPHIPNSLTTGLR